jgi:hypothetical protein
MAGHNAHNLTMEDPRRDEGLRSLLSALEPRREVMSFSTAIALIEAAPPVRETWLSRLAARPQPLRWAMAPLALLLAVSVLWAMPAQSDYVGTVVLAELPSNWQPGGPELAEVNALAREQVAALGIPQSEYYMLAGERAGRDSLSFVLIGLDPTQANALFDALSTRFPALAAFPAEINPVDSQRYGRSKLSELYVRLTQAGSASVAPDQLRTYVLQALQDAGLTDIEIQIRRTPDGRVVVEVDAAMSIAVDGRTQEELAAAGLGPEVLGEGAYRELLKQLAAGE